MTSSPSGWFAERRYGMFVHMSIASVPAFSPVHEYTEWYSSHLSPARLDDVVLHPAPMPEVQAWHAAHHPGLAYDDFIPQLTMERWDAPAIAQLAVDAGMGYVVHTSKHHDGYCFFDSALTERTTVRSGPRRDPVAELSAAARQRGLEYGLYYSLLDWSHPQYGSPAYVSGYLHPQVDELVRRYEPAVLWGDGHWGRPATYWRSDELLDRYREVVGDLGVVNDRWHATAADFDTYEYETPAEPHDRPFEVCRGIGYSFGWNRAETAADNLSASQIVALLTETVAKGGNLLLNVGPRADGTIPDEQASVLREAGRWVRRHARALDGSVRFDTWGNDMVRYTVTPSDDGLVHLNAIDLTGAARTRFAAVTQERFEVVTADGEAVHDRGGLVLQRPARDIDPLGVAHRLVLRPLATTPVVVRAPAAAVAARIGGREYSSVATALAAAQAGEVVEVSDGRRGPDDEDFPVRVPAGVTLRGHRDAVLDGGGRPTAAMVALAGDGAALEGLTIAGVSAPGFAQSAVGVLAEGCDDVVVRGVTLHQASVVVRDCARPRIVESSVAGGGIVVVGCGDGEVRANRQRGHRWGTGIDVQGGSGTVVVANDVADDLTGIGLHATTGGVVFANRLSTRWWGVHLDEAIDATVSANTVTGTMRAVCVSAGQGVAVVGNAMRGCDSGVLVERGASAVRLAYNTIDDCRVGILTWGSDQPESSGDRVLRSRQVVA